jgi:rod shape-determining protein MreD
MVYALRILLTSLIIFILQVTLVHRVTIAGARPDLVLVLLVVLVIDRGPIWGVLAGFLLGLLQDLGNASFLGMNALAKSIIGYGVARYGRDYLPESILFRGLLVFISALVCDLFELNITSGFNPVETLVSFFRYSILSALYTAILAVAVMQVIRLLPGRMVRPRGGL